MNNAECSQGSWSRKKAIEASRHINLFTFQHTAHFNPIG